MTTTLTAATLTVTVTEAVSLNGYDQGSKNTLTIASINEVNKRIVTVPASEIEVVAMSTANASGTFIEGDVRYMRFTNLDDTNHLTLTFKNENNDEFAVKLDKGQSFIYNADLSGGVVDTMDGIDGTGLTLSLGDLVNVTALADTAACDLEIFVACV
tara:strand:+ start:103 stop:573 length:471 start_codon:yes stop_codon:yes gene_type:complete